MKELFRCADIKNCSFDRIKLERHPGNTLSEKKLNWEEVFHYSGRVYWLLSDSKTSWWPGKRSSSYRVFFRWRKHDSRRHWEKCKKKKNTQRWKTRRQAAQNYCKCREPDEKQSGEATKGNSCEWKIAKNCHWRNYWVLNLLYFVAFSFDCADMVLFQ